MSAKEELGLKEIVKDDMKKAQEPKKEDKKEDKKEEKKEDKKELPSGLMPKKKDDMEKEASCAVHKSGKYKGNSIYGKGAEKAVGSKPKYKK